MKIAVSFGISLLTLGWAGALYAAPAHEPDAADAHSDEAADKAPPGKFEPFKPEASRSTGSVSVGGQSIAYQAVAGTLVIHPKGWDDVPKDPKPDKDNQDGDKNPTAVASMFYVAYFKNGDKEKNGNESRPITFLYNGGPGSSTMWLHLGAFGPRRVMTSTDAHTAPAPYPLVNNAYSLLDVSDLVFIDAPGTGFSRIAGKDKEKAFWGVDADSWAFSEFITQFLGKYGRWNSPKYLFGESYGTTRSAVLINELQSERAVDFNGVILLSQIFNFDLSPDQPTLNPGVDLPYQLVLPTYAASAFYHHKLSPDYKDLESLINEVEQFAMGEYAHALGAGSLLSAQERAAVAAKLHNYTGLPVDYILKADLRIDSGEFRQTLQGEDGMTTGRLDTRFAGPDIDPLNQRASYDPQATALSSAYVSAFNDYARRELRYGEGKQFKPSIPIFRSWSHLHQQPGESQPPQASSHGSNVMPDLANALKTNTNLKVQLNAGYFDLATPFFQGVYEMHHLQIPANLQNNIEYKFYDSGHMVYAKDESLKALHDNVAGFIRRTSK